MSRAFDGASSLTASPPFPTVTPMTFSCWFNVSDFTSAPHFINMADVTNNERFALLANADGTISAQTIHGGIAAVANTTASASTGAWHHACSVFTSPTSRSAYLDGANVGTNATSMTPAVLSFAHMGAIGAIHFLTGSLAFCAMYSTALSPLDIASLAAGWSPLRVHNSSLFSYTRMGEPIAPEVDLCRGRWGLTGTNTFAPNPKVIGP